MMTCLQCQHCRAERTGPHEAVHYCAFHFAAFPVATQCAHYRLPPADQAAVWPLDSDDWEWARGVQG